jgi:hypothetical protein
VRSHDLSRLLDKPGHSTHGALMRWCELKIGLVAIPSSLHCIGDAISGKMRLRTTAMAAPQHRQSSLGRSVGIVGVASAAGLPQGLNTSSRSQAINRLLLGCKNPSLRTRDQPLGNTCCSTRRKNSTPLTLRCADLPPLLSRQR